MKEPNYVMRMMATGGQLFSDSMCKETVRIWKENGKYMVGWLILIPPGVGWDIMGYES